MGPAQRRYASLFDWGIAHTMKFENGPHGYTLFKVGERSAGGAFQFEPDWGVTPAWQVYFEVTNFEASAARACALGGDRGFGAMRRTPGASGSSSIPAAGCSSSRSRSQRRPRRLTGLHLDKGAALPDQGRLRSLPGMCASSFSFSRQ